MKKYEKPIITEEKIELEDVIAVSNDGETRDGLSAALGDIFNLGN